MKKKQQQLQQHKSKQKPNAKEQTEPNNAAKSNEIMCFWYFEMPLNILKATIKTH